MQIEDIIINDDLLAQNISTNIDTVVGQLKMTAQLSLVSARSRHGAEYNDKNLEAVTNMVLETAIKSLQDELQ